MAVSCSEKRITCEGIPIVARIPEGWDRAMGVILAHGTGEDMDSPFMSFFSNGLSDLGCLSVKFSFPEIEEGIPAAESRAMRRETFRTVVGAVAAEFAPGLLVIGGKSTGGRTASHIAQDLDAVDGLVFLGYPLHPAGQPDKIRDEHFYEITKPMLFVSGTRDTLATRELLNGVIGKIGPLASVHWVDRGDHSFRSGQHTQKNRAEALAAVAQWLRDIRVSRIATA